MEHAEIELFLDREIPYAGHKRLPERPIIRPSGKDFVDGCVMNGRFAVGVVWYGQALPLHPRVEDPEDEVKDSIIAQFALRPTFGHREVRQDKCFELRFGELHRNRRRYRLWCRSAHHAIASWKEGGGALDTRITSEATRG